MNPIVPTTPHIEIDGGTDNRCYTQSFSDIIIPARPTSSFAIISEVPINTTHSPCSSVYNHHSHCQKSDLEPFERQLSLLDPMSDRVSTILVWQNLTVQIREDKKKEAFQRMKSYKTFVPKRKCLLNNISGAIAGGLWAVMGKFYLSM
jgi:hypothetical protein